MAFNRKRYAMNTKRLYDTAKACHVLLAKVRVFACELMEREAQNLSTNVRKIGLPG
jgi:hypothetical protein